MCTKALLFCIFLVSFGAAAQITETYYSNPEGLEDGTIKDHIKDSTTMILAGAAMGTYSGQPVVFRLDSFGDVVWSTIDFDTAVYSNFNAHYAHQICMDDSFIYAVIVTESWPYMYKELWKIDAATGAFVWRNDFYSSYLRRPEHLIDYDSSHFIIAYNEAQLYPKFALISKLTGDTTSTHLIHYPYSARFGIGKDSDHNLYVTYNSHMVKRSAANPNTILWDVQHSSAQISAFQHVHLDENDSLYFFGSRDASLEFGKVLEINRLTGEMNWHLETSYGSMAFEDLVDRDGYLYVAWRHIYVGGGSYPFMSCKIDKAGDSLMWINSHVFTGVGSPDVHSGNSMGIRSIDVDNSGHVYLTGYYRDANYGPEAWGMIKVNGTTGITAFEKTITEDVTTFDNISVGMVACVFSNRLYFVGELETYHLNYYERNKLCYVRMDPATGTTLVKKYVNPGHQFPSKTLDITNDAFGNASYLKQLGTTIRIEHYDFNGNQNWIKTLSSTDKVLFGERIHHLMDSTTLVVASTSGTTSSYPYYSANRDSLHFYWIASNGSFISHLRAPVGLANIRVTDIISDSNKAYVFYSKNNVLYCLRVTSANVSSETLLQITAVNSTSLGHPKYVVHGDSNTALICGLKSGMNRVISLNKNTLTSTNIGVINSFQSVYHVEKGDSHDLFICGKSTSGFDQLIHYNYLSQSIYWTQTYDPSSHMYGFVFDADSTYLYTMSQSSNDIVVKKVNSTTGVQLWATSYNGQSGLEDNALDIAFDPFRGHLVLSGYEQHLNGSSNYKSVWIGVIDTNGSPIDTIVKHGAFPGDNFGQCVEVLPNGRVLAGGNLNHPTLRKAGFIYELYDPLFCQAIVNDTGFCSYTSQSGNWTWTSSGTYIDTISGSNCDSLVVYNLSLGTYSNQAVVNGCDSFSWSVNGQSYTQSGVYMETFTSSLGCDSTEVLNLTMNNSYLMYDSVTSCDTYNWIATGLNYNSSGNYVALLTSSAGCDSTEVLNLTINNAYMMYDSITSCGTYNWVATGLNYDSSGNYVALLTSATGCDSTINLSLKVKDANSDFTDSAGVLKATDSFAAYQWLKCSGSFVNLLGDTFQTYVVQDTGSYALAVYKDGCVDTSQCVSITNVGLLTRVQGLLQVYPNPTQGRLTIFLPENYPYLTVHQLDLSGRPIEAYELNNLETQEITLKGSAGIYLLQLQSQGLRISQVRVVKY
ncbi:MAG: T9SS type A sorting domain-containing protein [Flavobacteriales bacterium]